MLGILQYYERQYLVLYDALKISPAMRTINYLAGLDGREALQSLLSVRYYEKNGELVENASWLPFGVQYASALSEEDFCGCRRLKGRAP